MAFIKQRADAGDTGSSRNVQAAVGCSRARSKAQSPKAQADQVIRAELFGARHCFALGISVQAYAPVCALARKLIAAGHHGDRQLEDSTERRSTFVLKLEAKSGPAGIRQLRALLKTLLRRHGFRCIDAREETEHAP